MANAPTSRISAQAARSRAAGAGTLFAVYAPFGTDPELSRHPGAVQLPIEQQPLVRRLLEVACCGVDVAALVDLHQDDTWLVEIPAHAPQRMSIVSAWKQNMASPAALAGFLRRAHARFQCRNLVLALEGHGAGFLPEIDPSRITPANTNRDDIEWRIGAGSSAPYDSTGAPILPAVGFPVLGTDSPEVLPVTLPMSTWAVAEALKRARQAGVPKPAVIHFDNCFNMALEHLHTIAPHAGVATGYANYNFFTAGDIYPPVFERLQRAGSATAEQLARWMAEANHTLLSAKHNHPTVGGTIRLSRMKGVAAAVDHLALMLVGALRADRATHQPRIRDAVGAALQYDTEGDFGLDVPDQATDLGSLAARLQEAYPTGDLHDAAVGVESALKGVWQYGDSGQPHMARAQFWDFRDPRFGMSILLPDPSLIGRWDWRSPYYMAAQADPVGPPAMRAQIPFLANRPDGSRAPWPLFIEEFHQGVKFQGLLRAKPPRFPVYNAKAEPGQPEPPRDEPKKSC